MSESKKKKLFDMTTLLTKTETVNEIPRRASGRLSIDWKPLLKLVLQKGIVRISENDARLGSVANGIIDEAKRQSIEIVTNTRKIDGIVWLYIQKPLKK